MSSLGEARSPNADHPMENESSERSDAGSSFLSPSPRAKQHKQPDEHRKELPSLVHLCRQTIVSNLERFPPEAFDILDPVEWDELVKLRFESTRPKRAKEAAGSAINGRLVPVVSAKYLQAVEEVNPHLANSTEADELLWKYCVEFKFRQGGLTRPVALNLPWPQLVERVRSMGELLCDGEQSFVAPLSTMPMNVSLLRDSGIGKLVKKAIKKCTALDASVRERLKQLVATWIKVAEAGSQVDEDLTVAESCSTWRDLYRTLSDRNDQVRNSQGQRMREIRKNLAISRPKLVKVSLATPKQQAILAGMNSTKAAQTQKGKIAMIQNEAKMQALRQQRIVPKRKAAFGDAVAFASGTKKGAAYKRQKAGGTVHHLDGGQRFLKMPNMPLRTTKRK